MIIKYWNIFFFLIFFLLLVPIKTKENNKNNKKDQLKIGITYRPTKCERKTKIGDTLKIHYTGTLEDGTKFDSSLDRGQPFTFILGKGQVIQGWDEGLRGMCVGEKRRLKIPPSMAYGERGMPPTIPAKSTLIFETELIEIVNSK